MELSAHVVQGLDTPAPEAEVFALLADVPRSVLHFPDTESVRSVGGYWEWRLRKLGVGPLSLQVHYGARYTVTDREVSWAPVAGLGNAQVSGRWRLEPLPRGTRMVMDTRFVLSAPFPALMRGAAEAIVDREIRRLIQGYLENLRTTLTGGDGRTRG